MSSHFESAGLNNHAVALLEKGSLWDAFETFNYALACLNDEQDRRPTCCCRLLNACGSLQQLLPGSRDNTTTAAWLGQGAVPLDTDAQRLLHEGKHCHINGYEWVDCKAKLQQLYSKDGDNSHRDKHHQQQSKYNHEHSHDPSAQPNFPSKPSHDSWLAFLSLGVIRIHCNPYSEDRRPGHLQCDCATRWAVMHK